MVLTDQKQLRSSEVFLNPESKMNSVYGVCKNYMPYIFFNRKNTSYNRKIFYYKEDLDMMILCKGLICGVLTILIIVLMWYISLAVSRYLDGLSSWWSIKEIIENFELTMQREYGCDKPDIYKNLAVSVISMVICEVVSVILYNLMF